MFSKTNFKKISYWLAIMSIIIFLFGFFGISFRGDLIVTNVIDINIPILAPLKNIIVDFCGSDYGQLIYNIVCLNLVWYVVVGFPVWVYNLVKGVLVK